jgi:hypothetical protein
MKALGLLGLGRQDEAILHFESVLKLEANHQGALNHMDWSWEGKSNE